MLAVCELFIEEVQDAQEPRSVCLEVGGDGGDRQVIATKELRVADEKRAAVENRR